MRFRKLRIAWSVLCGIACVLLIALWVRSYRYVETVLCKFSDDVLIYAGSLPGELGFSIVSEESVEPWIVYKQPSEKWLKGVGDRWLEQTWGGFRIDIDNAGIMAPYWFLVSIFATVGTLAWIHKLKWKFSLRTLLIATTLVAVVLGLIVWLGS
jgi:hypothetical protein